MSGGKGGKSTSTVQVPAWLETAAKGNLARADELARIGYTPYSGPDVAALTPMQVEAMRNTGSAAQAFGLGAVDPMAGMPTPQTFAGGVQGYSSMPMYEEALAALEARAPGQFAALQAPFINPVTGAQPNSPFGFGSPLVPTAPGANPADAASFGGGYGFDAQQAGLGSGAPAATGGPGLGGYTGLGDMFDGGGPGKSGDTFSGGPFSGVANMAGISPMGSDGPSGMGGGKR